MLIFNTKSKAGFHDFLPSFSKVFVQRGNLVLYDWHTYRRWLPLLFAWNCVVFLLVCHGIYSHLDTGRYPFATLVAMLYLLGVGLRRTLTKRLEEKMSNVISIVSAPRIAWADAMMHSITGLVMGCLMVAFTSGPMRMAALVFPALYLADLLLPFVNLFIFRSQKDKNLSHS